MTVNKLLAVYFQKISKKTVFVMVDNQIVEARIIYDPSKNDRNVYLINSEGVAKYSIGLDQEFFATEEELLAYLSHTKRFLK